MNESQLISFFQPYRRYAAFSDVLKVRGVNLFYRAVFGGHHEKTAALAGEFLFFFCRFGKHKDGGNFLVLHQGQKIHYGFSFCGALALRQVVHFYLINLSSVAEKQQIVVRVGGKKRAHEIFFFSIYIYHAYASSFLRFIRFRVGPFNVAVLRQNHYLVF